jgi:hypothetical protein
VREGLALRITGACFWADGLSTFGLRDGASW